jgi:uncharacterized protein (TIGR00730 family)
MSRRVVTFGSSRAAEGDAEWVRAYAVGQELGRRGLTVVSGGYDGTMGAVSRGAREAGGRVVGITTGVFHERMPNEFLHEHASLATYQDRMARLLGEGDAYVVFGGGLGTLSEWLSAWCLASIAQLRGPLWIFEDPWKPIADVVAALREVRAEHPPLLQWVRDPHHLGAQLDAWLEDTV